MATTRLTWLLEVRAPGDVDMEELEVHADHEDPADAAELKARLQDLGFYVHEETLP